MSVEIPARPLPNSYWVLPGEFLAGEHPLNGVGSPMAARERLRELMDVGIDCFIDLTMPSELDTYEHELPSGVRYVRRPIRDHGIPARMEHMAQIIADLQRSLREGRCIYLHCRAGIGRTGMVAGCFLVEQGATGDGALDRLNQLWLQCARSSSWPYVPETEAQIEFVRNWAASAAADLPSLPAAPQSAVRINPRPAPPSADPASARVKALDRTLRDRFHGAMLGLAVGDALTIATRDRKAGDFAPVAELTGGGPSQLPAGAWTDDTSMALCLAASLLECDGFDAHDQVDRYTRWQKEGYLSATGECVGITANAARALGAAQWRRQLFAGSHDPQQLDPEVLRVAPAVMFAFGDPQEALRLACDSARTTCQAPLALEACQLFAALLYAALAGESKEQVLRPQPTFLDPTALRPKTSVVLSKRLIAGSKPPRLKANTLDALAAALWAFQSTDNFRDGALRAANLGGPCDVVAAAYGQLAGAFYGVQAIPPAWRNALLQKALIEGFAERLFGHACRRPME